MLYISLIVSSIVLLLTNVFAWKSTRPLPKILKTSIAVGLGSLGPCMILLPPVLVQSLSLVVIVLVWNFCHWHRRTFTLLSSGTTLMVYAVLGFLAFQDMRHLQQEFGYVSLQDHLPSPTHPRSTAILTVATTKRLDKLEALVEDSVSVNGWRNRPRKNALRALHENAVQVFVDQPQFGVARMIGTRQWLSMSNLRREPPLPQPAGTSFPLPYIPDFGRDRQDIVTDRDELSSMHIIGAADFANPIDFGLIDENRHRVVGFQEHHVRSIPELPESWKLQRLDLIGLILHTKPVAYVSENLPRMDELRSASTRSLDEFETVGLSALHRGDDLFVRQNGRICRAIGALRAVRQCLVCHDVERGDLLGAFSYTLMQDRK